MAYVLLDDQIAAHPKVLKAGAEAAWMWACAIAYCNRQLTDGLVPAEALPTMGTFKTAPAKLAARLVDVGLFERDGDGYRVHDYLAHNPDKGTVQARRAASSARQAAHRSRPRNGEVTHMSQRDTGATPPLVTGLSQRDTDVTAASSRACVPTPTPTPTVVSDDTTTPAPAARLVSSSTGHSSGPEHLACLELVAAWNRIRSAPSVDFTELQPPSKRLIRDALRAKGLDAWERIFGRIAASEYLSGRLDMPVVSLFKALELGDRIDAGQYDTKAPVTRRSAEQAEQDAIWARFEAKAKAVSK